MHKIGLLASIIVAFNFSACGELKKTTSDESGNQIQIESQIVGPIEVGAAQLSRYLPLLEGKRVAMMVNQTSVVGESHSVDTLLQWGVNIVKIFAPEHGFRGDHSAGAHVKSTTDAKTGLPIVSLYGSSRKPNAAMVQGIDVVIFDIQDVGVRFYTYISSMHYLMESCVENDLEMMVLDRPNPNGHYVDGPVLDIKYKSFIGMHPVPLVHGMTVGEFATMINGERWLTGGDTCKLTVIKCKNYTHDSMYQLPIRPSPNLPTMESIYLYPSLGLFEGTNVSIGRGTDKPFEVIGRPIDYSKINKNEKVGSGSGKGPYAFKPKSIPGVSDHPKYEGVICQGIVLTNFANTYIVSNKRIYLQWLTMMHNSNNPSQTGVFFKPFFTKLAGGKALQQQIETGVSQEDIYKSWEPGLTAFKIIRTKYLLY
ncbi:MAG: hypothetical protein ACI9JN_000803 [Bacteroidia bacterium]|jgi:uncharacterized protein YbbC (DUF1343 family)